MVDPVAGQVALEHVVEPADRVRLLTGYMSAPTLGTLLRRLKTFDMPDFKILEDSVSHVAKALNWVKSRELRGERKTWNGMQWLGLGEESLTSYPGIYWRSHGYKDKLAVEDDALKEMWQAHAAIVSGEHVEPRPCAMFGRGKRTSGDVESPIVAEPHPGRLVLACDTRDHLLLMPFAQRVEEYIYSNWEHTNIMLGTSWQRRGVTQFLYNIIVDLLPNLGRRLNFHARPTTDEARQMDATVNLFTCTAESDYRYFVLDVRRQDATLNTMQMDFFFEFMRSVWFVPDGRLRRKFGRLSKWIRQYMVHTPIALPDGQVWHKHKGNVSGSPLTTQLNCYTALVLAATCVVQVFGQDALERGCIRVYGDNVLVVVPKQGTCDRGLPDLLEAAKLTFEQEFNPDESYEAQCLVWRPWHTGRESAQFLSKHLGERGVIWRSSFDTYSSMSSPETRTLSAGERWARAIGLLYDNPFNIESVIFLNEILDDLWWNGTASGEVGEHAQKKLKYKLPFTEYSKGWSSHRPSILEAQALYMFTHEVLKGQKWPEPDIGASRGPYVVDVVESSDKRRGAIGPAERAA